MKTLTLLALAFLVGNCQGKGKLFIIQSLLDPKIFLLFTPRQLHISSPMYLIDCSDALSGCSEWISLLGGCNDFMNAKCAKSCKACSKFVNEMIMKRPRLKLNGKFSFK